MLEGGGLFFQSSFQIFGTPSPGGNKCHFPNYHNIVCVQGTNEVNRMGENSSFIFACYVKTGPAYDFKIVWVVLHLSVKKFFKTIY